MEDKGIFGIIMHIGMSEVIYSSFFGGNDARNRYQ